eukprot:CAMPEP_0203669518 /NCGR_PEP_ID=MMETSP0090-20130426/5866_1 /ASSEMBLY_ACC=CAM_ASM_001088 /TAXON_ID=426623 /ORGANISM="Chaetoceros affinis, Strain CCMP159" /LENGTH=771 /DNA_ID=CAMNT_0050534221 /DNA_START=404 /DNA_END=2719 /DNA_ORIENTATION=+
MSSLLRKHRELNKKKNEASKAIDNDGFPMVKGAAIDVDDNQKLWGVGATTTTSSTSSSTTPSVTYAQPNREKQPPLSYDNYTFAPMPALPPNFVPISSCDELAPGKDNGDTLEPPDFMDESNTTTMKISSNFTKLIVNAKKVDMVRHNKAVKQRKNNKKNNSDEIKMITDPKDADEIMKKMSNDTDDNSNSNNDGSATKNDNNNDLSAVSVQKAQQNLIEQLKQGLDFLTNQNKHLLSHGDSLTTQMNKERADFKAQLEKTQKELEERNFKLAVLEQHFMALNNPDSPSAGASAAATTTTNSTNTVGSNSDSAAAVTEKSVTSSSPSSSSSKGDQDGDNGTTKVVKSSVSSSIVQIDKGYLTDLEKVAQVQKRALEKFEKENATLTDKVKTFTVELDKKERTITKLESSLKQTREARFGRKTGGGKSSHRRRNTESVIISTAAITTAAPTPTTAGGAASATPSLSAHSDDDLSISNASGTTASIAEERNKQQGTLNAVVLEEEITKAVKEALEKKEKDHTSTMDVLSHQLDLKDKIIKRHEMKIYSLLNRKGDETNSTRQARQVPQDVIIRNISVTNELMDTSIRKLEKMMDQLELIEKEKRTDLADELSPIRRVATKVSLVHEEMKVSIKLIEQKIRNDVEKIKQISEEEENARDKDDGDDSEENSGQKSGEDVDGVTVVTTKSSLEDRISEVLSESMKTLKETETSVKGEIDALTEQLQSIEYELEGKQDTIEALELACSEHVQNCRKMQEEIEQLKLGSGTLTGVTEV